MSEKYGSHKEWTFGMECELPYKVCFALDKSPDSMTFLEVKRGGDTVIRLFSDMGGKTRTIEMGIHSFISLEQLGEEIR